MKPITKNTPVLRFPEFDGDLNERRLGEIVLSHNSGIYKSSNLYGTGTNIIGVSDLYSISSIDGQEFSRVPLTPKELSKFSLEEGDLIYGESSLVREGIAKSLFVSQKGAGTAFEWHTRRFKVDAREVDSCYLNYNLGSPLTRRRIMRVATQTALTGITTKDYFDTTVHLPGLSEQKKIATFLTAVDAKLRRLSRKKGLLMQYQKGVLQQIFDQKIRFKGASESNYPNWERKKFGEVFSFRVTNSFSRDDLDYNGGEVKNIHYGDIHTKFKTLFDISKENVPFIKEEISLARIAQDNYCKPGDLILADASEDYADIGKCIEITNLNGEKVLAGLHTLMARPDLLKMESGFMGYMMQSRKVRLQIMTIAQGSKVLSISAGRLANVELELPSAPEQKKIANFLIAIDKKIDQVTAQIDNAKTFKEGLLQQMFV